MTKKTGPVPERSPRPHWWSYRSTGDVLILMVTFTVCTAVVFSGAVVAFITITQPEQDVTVWVNRNSGIITTMLGVMAGYLAGKTDLASGKHVEPPE